MDALLMYWGYIDSTLGKAMEKVGHVVKSEEMVDKGHARRASAGLGKEKDDDPGELEGKYEAN